MDEIDESMASRGRSLTCSLCQKSVSTSNAMSIHKRDQHDGEHVRIFALICQWCSIKPLNTRTGLEKHLALRCPGIDDLHFPLSCPFCDTECEGRDTLSKHSLSCYSWKQDSASDEQFLDEFNKELNRVTRLPATSRFMEQVFEKAELRLANGEREYAFIIPRGSKRLISGSKAHVHIVKRRALEVAKDVQLDAALESHVFGRLVCLEDYRRLESDDPLWHLPFPDNGELLATVFEGMLIQSGPDILYALKVEAYGAADYEDPHSQELAKPVGKSAFQVENVSHDQTRKVMIGGVKWCILVTLAVLLADVTVIVGPDNKFFYPSAKSFVSIKKKSYDSVKNPVQDFYNTMARQLRSKYDEEATLAPYSARKIMKADVQANIKEGLIGRSGKACESLGIIERMVQVMADEEAFPVSKSVNKCLTELARILSGEITNLNKTVVKDAVIKRIKSMLVE
ncbi:hypothetical protein BGZ52_005268 [Haplosporangium bisporale]|nr:hypothetical protein BGZ52_005268 [Haplosporangium bisporale]